jgi:hypothetical protein
MTGEQTIAAAIGIAIALMELSAQTGHVMRGLNLV